MFSLILWLAVFYAIVRLFSRGHAKTYRWLQRQLPSWEQKNIINTGQGNAILGLYKLKRIELRDKVDVIKVLTLVGAVFMGIGVIFFVASNWQRIPAQFRVFMLLAITVSTLYAGYFFSYERSGLIQLGKSLCFLASLFWGGTLALIGQIYNIPVSENWFIILLWAFPIVPVAVFLGNDYAHILASSLFLIWNFLYTVNNSTANYYYPAIIFSLMLPTSKNLTLSRRVNVFGLISACLYCCFNKYEWLALIISLGLLACYLIQKRERAYLYAACFSFILWDITFFTVRQQQLNPYFILPIGFILYLTYRDGLMENLVICLIGLMVWLNLTLSSISQVFGFNFDLVDFIVFQSMSAIAVYSAGVISKKSGYLFSNIYKIFGYSVMLCCVYLLSFRSILEAGIGVSNSAYVFASLSIAAVSALLIADAARGGYFKNNDARMEMAGLLAALIGSVIIAANQNPVSANTFIANAVLAVFAVTNIFFGVEAKSPRVFTAGVIVFAMLIITRYIDMGWRLKEKSLFFIAGGIVILSMGTFLEKQRRKVIERMKQNE